MNLIDFDKNCKEIKKLIEKTKLELKEFSNIIQMSLGAYNLFEMALNNYFNSLKYIENKSDFQNNDFLKELANNNKNYTEKISKMKEIFSFFEESNELIDLHYNEIINYPDYSSISLHFNQNELNNSRRVIDTIISSPYFFKNFIFMVKSGNLFYHYKIYFYFNLKLREWNCIFKYCRKENTHPIIKDMEYYSNENYNNNNNNINFNSNDIISHENLNNNNNENKNLFLNSIEILIKNILMRCNYILNNEELIMGGNNQIKILDYLIINNENNDCLNFINKLYNISNEFNQSIFNLPFNLSNLNKSIITIVRKINNSIKDQNNDDSIKNLNNSFDSNSDDNFEKGIHNESLRTNFGNCFSVNSILKSNSESEIRDKLTRILMQNLSINNEDIFISFNDNNKNIFINNFIKSKKFLSLSIDDIKQLYPNLEELHEYKIIFDSLIKECDIKDYIDYRGNFIIQNMKETKEKYYPPYDWIGIGLKVLGKYDNDNWLIDNSRKNEWAIAYHGVGGKLSITQVKNKLKNKIKLGLKQGKSQRQCNLYDFRHHGKKIGTGVYLTPIINIAEDFSGIIQLNKTKYKVALMAKVKIDKIRQSNNTNSWILNSKYIRIYRILLKKIKIIIKD